MKLPTVGCRKGKTFPLPSSIPWLGPANEADKRQMMIKAMHFLIDVNSFMCMGVFTEKK